jgi:hypothetical protein
MSSKYDDKNTYPVQNALDKNPGTFFHTAGGKD